MLTHRSRIMLMATLLFVEMLSALEISMVATALPTIAREFSDLAGAGWLIASFGLAQAATAAVLGSLGDLFGRRKLLLVVTCLSATGSLISGFGGNLEIIIVGRAIQGAAGAILPLAIGLTQEFNPRENVSFWVGCLIGVYIVGSGLGFVIGGALTQLGSWQWLFHFTAAYAVIALIPILLFVPASKPARSTQRLDLVGGLLFLPAVSLLLYSINSVAKLGWTDPVTLGTFLGGAVLLVAWVFHELRHPNPLIDVRLLREPAIALGNLCFALLGLGIAQTAVVFLILVQQPVWTGAGLGVGAAMAGLLKIPSNVSSAIAAPFAGISSQRFGARTTVLCGALTGLAGVLTMFFLHTSLIGIVVGSMIATMALAMLLSGVPNLVLEACPDSRASESTGLTVVVRGVFASIGVQIATSVLASSQVADPRTGALYPTKYAYTLQFGFMAFCLVVMILMILLFSRVDSGKGSYDKRGLVA